GNLRKIRDAIGLKARIPGSFKQGMVTHSQHLGRWPRIATGIIALRHVACRTGVLLMHESTECTT
ncbi:MAG: hypothetical protein KGL00_08635, partial [Gammaproteobacteria bacterium]|nr:hypothetical protein [Gammaproteobacteria bacterium]